MALYSQPVIKAWLNRTSNINFTIYALVVAFGVYFCMYAFRKPFTAAAFDNKEILVIAQVLGYLASKFFGIRFISELKGQKRAYLILYLIGFSHLTLLAFAYLPDSLRSYDFLLLFLNGLPLGVIWGIVFSYLEGRKFTEILSAGLTMSFIISSGFVKSVGKSLMLEQGVDSYHMPLVTGLIFLPITFLFVWMLSQIPPPKPEDVELRSERTPMTASLRREFFTVYAPGLIMLIFSYMLFTGYRDIRETFANEIWANLGITDASIFTQTELPVGIIVGIVMAVFFRIKDSLVAFVVYHLMILVGLGMILAATFGFTQGVTGPISWMIIIGIGAYLAYVTYASVLFDRLMAASRFKGNAGFMIYVADSMGYLGSVLIMLFKRFGTTDLNWYDFFVKGSFLIASVGILLVAGSLIYFLIHFQQSRKLITT